METEEVVSVNERSLSDSELSSSLLESVARLHRRLETEEVADRGATVGEVAVLSLLLRQGERTLGELAIAERLRPPSMTRIVARLEANGYVGRRADPTDGRQVLVGLSDRGRELLVAEGRRRDAWLDRRLRDLKADERTLLRQAASILEKCLST